MSRLLVAVVALAAGVGACSSSSDPQQSAATVECRARTGNVADVKSGCICRPVGATWSSSNPTVPRCDDTYAGPTTMCCQDTDSCYCAYVGCVSDSFSDTCSCGFDMNAVLSSQVEVGTCPVPTGGRCCANDANGDCGCDTLDPACGASWGDRNVSSCTATTVPPKCASGRQVPSCSSP